jgi:hypothetical protein
MIYAGKKRKACAQYGAEEELFMWSQFVGDTNVYEVVAPSNKNNNSEEKKDNK